MATLTKGRTFASGEVVTPAKLNALVDDAAVGDIVDADIKSDAAIAGSKLADLGVSTAKLANGAVTAAKVADGAVVQVVQTTNATRSTHTAVIPNDDTVPLVSKGDEILTQAITPATATNKVLVRVNLPSVYANFGGTVSVFRGSTCINAGPIQTSTSTVALFVSWSCEILDSPASASPVTYSVRIGSSLAPWQVYLNGSTARFFGGASKATLTLMEIKSS